MSTCRCEENSLAKGANSVRCVHQHRQGMLTQHKQHCAFSCQPFAYTHLPPKQLCIVHANRRAKATWCSLPSKVRGADAQPGNESSIHERAKDGTQDLHSTAAIARMHGQPQQVHAPQCSPQETGCANIQNWRERDCCCVTLVVSTDSTIILC